MMTKKGYLPDCYLCPEDFVPDGCYHYPLHEECLDEYEFAKENNLL